MSYNSVMNLLWFHDWLEVYRTVQSLEPRFVFPQATTFRWTDYALHLNWNQIITKLCLSLFLIKVHVFSWLLKHETTVSCFFDPAHTHLPLSNSISSQNWSNIFTVEFFPLLPFHKSRPSSSHCLIALGFSPHSSLPGSLTSCLLKQTEELVFIFPSKDIDFRK